MWYNHIVTNKCFIIDGRRVAEQIRFACVMKAKEFERKYGRKCGLSIIWVGENSSSEIYIRNKTIACEQVGIKIDVHHLRSSVTQDEVLALIDRLNKSADVDGILIQLPLPNHIKPEIVLERVAPDKDVDGLGSTNVARLFSGYRGIAPCTALAVMELIKSTGVALTGKRAVVVGRSALVGRPVAQLLLNADCTVTTAHTKTQNLGTVTREADILVVAAGSKHLVKADMVKPGAVVIDVGINRVTGKADERTIYGDVDFDNVQRVAGYLTPVPGGVGPVTVAMLLRNVLGN